VIERACVMDSRVSMEYWCGGKFDLVGCRNRTAFQDLRVVSASPRTIGPNAHSENTIWRELHFLGFTSQSNIYLCDIPTFHNMLGSSEI